MKKGKEHDARNQSFSKKTYSLLKIVVVQIKQEDFLLLFIE
jgi:hypothetical protein